MNFFKFLNVDGRCSTTIRTIGLCLQLMKFGMGQELCAKFSLFSCIGSWISSEEEEEEEEGRTLTKPKGSRQHCFPAPN